MEKKLVMISSSLDIISNMPKQVVICSADTFWLMEWVRNEVNYKPIKEAKRLNTILKYVGGFMYWAEQKEVKKYLKPIEQMFGWKPLSDIMEGI